MAANCLIRPIFYYWNIHILITLRNMVKNKNYRLTYTYFSNSDSDFTYHAIKDDMRNKKEAEE